MIKYTPTGHQVTLKACLQSYPTVCSTAVTYNVEITECEIVTFVNNNPQPDITQFIFDVAVSENIVSYTQTPLCGWTLTYTAAILGSPTNLSPRTGPQAIVTGNPDWATLDTTPAAPKWTIKSTNYLDADTYSISQKVTLNNKIRGVAQNTFVSHNFQIFFYDPCLISNSFIK